MANVVYMLGQPGSVGYEIQPKEIDLVVYQGDDFTYDVYMKYPNRRPIDLAGWVGRCEIKRDSEVHEAEITVGEATDHFNISISGDITTQMTGVYDYDIEFTLSDSTVHTLVFGKLTVGDDVTD